jgi:cytochrome c
MRRMSDALKGKFRGPSLFYVSDKMLAASNDFTQQVRDMGIEQVLCAPRSPWLELGDASRGQKIFDSKRCTVCHDDPA